MATVLKTYQPQLEKEYRYWMAGADALAPGSADKRAVRMADGALLNRYWDDNDTPRRVGLTTSKPPKATRIVRQPRSIATCAPPPPPAGISAPAGWTIRSSSPPFAPPRLSRSISMP